MPTVGKLESAGLQSGGRFLGCASKAISSLISLMNQLERESGFRLLITGGAGFIGANLGVFLSGRHPNWEITALDNLYRQGSRLSLSRLEEAGVRFVEGDVRMQEDLLPAEEFDALVECSAEPSVLAGAGDPRYAIETNLMGAANCLERCRKDDAHLVFLSTSRIYPVEGLLGLDLEDREKRFEIAPDQPIPGASPEGISEEFNLSGFRTIYGTTKLAAEMLIEEYAEDFGLRVTVDRCGVIAGPGQMGKVDQGVFAWWLLCHLFKRPLSYIGFGGEGKQVRDLLHVMDLVDLIERQLVDPGEWSGIVANVGGGREGSLSLIETTELCREITGNEVALGSDPGTRPGDVPIYLSDCSRLYSMTDWRPKRGPMQVLQDLYGWATEHEVELKASLGLNN